MATTPGRRVDIGEGGVFDALQEPGDYCPIFDEDGKTIKWLWLILPPSKEHIGRLPNEGYGSEEGPEWKITLEDDGTVTVDPSIQQHPIEAKGGYPGLPGWHGWLRRGQWESA